MNPVPVSPLDDDITTAPSGLVCLLGNGCVCVSIYVYIYIYIYVYLYMVGFMVN